MFPDSLVKERDITVNTYEEAIAELEENFRIRYERTSLENIRLREQGYISWNIEYHPMTLWAIESLCNLTQIPFDYAGDVEFDHFIYDFDQRKRTKCSSVVVWLNESTVINVWKSPLHVPRHTEVIKKFEKLNHRWQAHGIRISDRGMELSTLSPSLVIEPQPGDPIQAGLRITNSETGYKKLTCSYFTLVLKCLNGAVGRDELGVVRWDYDQRMPIEHSLDKFFEKVELMDDRLIGARLTSIYKSLTTRHLLDIELIRRWRSIGNIVGEETADMVVGFTTEQRRKLLRKVRNRDNGALPEKTAFTGYSLYNRVTDWAKRFDFVTWRRMERLAGRWLTLSAVEAEAA